MFDMTPKRWVVLATFEAETPEDELEADAHADRISAELEAAINAFPYVVVGTVRMQEVDTLKPGDSVGLTSDY